MDIMLLHDSHNEFYRTPSGPAPAGSNVLIRLHCDEATSVVLRTWMTEELCYTMLPTAEHVWEVAIPLPTTPGLFWYYFLIYRKDGRTIRYGNQPDKLGGVGVAYDHGEPESFQITLYDPAYKTPEAFHGANIYQIFPDRFRHAPTKAVDDRKDRYVHQNWDEELLGVGDLRGGKYQELDFYGGTLTGIQEKLPYLKDMGIDIIYLNPIFRARSNHRYDTGDYTQVDPLCGTNTEFTELCEEAKKVGIRVMLDGVFSHTGEDSVYFNHFGHYPTLGAYQGQSSPYYDWYTFNHYPEDYKAWRAFSPCRSCARTIRNTRSSCSSRTRVLCRVGLRRAAAAGGWMWRTNCRWTSCASCAPPQRSPTRKLLSWAKCGRTRATRLLTAKRAATAQATRSTA